MVHKNEELNKLRHSAAHLLGHAILELFPETQLTIGPATETGFFYDFRPSVNFKESDLELITQRMREIVTRDLPLAHEEISKEKARQLYKNNPFKLELIDGIPGDSTGLATQGNFHDLCKGGHIARTNQLKYFKLTGISGSYWRADRDGIPLQRISGVVFPTQEEFDAYEKQIEEAMMYDHRKLGKQLDLFSFHDEGVGFPFFHPKGKTILNIMRSYMRRTLHKAGYLEIETPLMLCDDLWKQSGHYSYYKDNMYFSNIDEKSYAVRPMNCPGAVLIYKERPRSYRELPLRLMEFGKVHRHELSGVLHGLFRVRSFTIDDTHFFCTLDQIQDEIITNISIVASVMKKFGFTKFKKIGVSTRPEKSMGDDASWERATNALTHALDKIGLPYIIQEGEGAFYGPKIEFKVEDSMGREWQCGTIQVDFCGPVNFDLHYVAPSGKLERPVMLHQGIYGSLERFLGVLLEHNKGHLPFWLSPLQAKILTISDEQEEYAQTILSQLQELDIRAEIDSSSDPLPGKIKNAQLKKIPLMIVVGKKEQQSSTITFRHHDGKQEQAIPLTALADKIIALL